ncbi:hypothetical protein K456DRAFT_251123 [Colletotrichum gloeosporioides 23]|nr:hypothetical protein K456DRAFT_251123 [Colletotrichum gloeosporioides 23]
MAALGKLFLSGRMFSRPPEQSSVLACSVRLSLAATWTWDRQFFPPSVQNKHSGNANTSMLRSNHCKVKDNPALERRAAGLRQKDRRYAESTVATGGPDLQIGY